MGTEELVPSLMRCFLTLMTYGTSLPSRFRDLPLRMDDRYWTQFKLVNTGLFTLEAWQERNGRWPPPSTTAGKTPAPEPFRLRGPSGPQLDQLQRARHRQRQQEQLLHNTIVYGSGEMAFTQYEEYYDPDGEAATLTAREGVRV